MEQTVFRGMENIVQYFMPIAEAAFVLRSVYGYDNCGYHILSEHQGESGGGFADKAAYPGAILRRKYGRGSKSVQR